jgi:hypothetical protein
MNSAHNRSLLPLLALAGAALPAPAQEQAGPPAPNGVPIDQWLPMDGVAVVVNSDPITERGLQRRVNQRMSEVKISTIEEYRSLQLRTVLDQVDTLLMRQAGEDLGFPKEAVEAHIQDQIHERKEEVGGIHDLSQTLRADDQTQEALSESLETELYEVSFKRRILGYASPEERTAEDRFVRPGMLARQYRHIQRTGMGIGPLLTRAGASPALYELQILLFDPSQYGSMEAARETANQAHKALVSGQAEWDRLIDTVGALPDRGLLGPRTVEDLHLRFDPGDNRLVQFIMEGREDVYSSVMPFPRVNPANGERLVAAFAIYRLLGREAATVPKFGAPGIQKALRRVLEAEADNARLKTALNELKINAYVWYMGIEEEQAALEARQAERERKVIEERKRNAELLRRARARESTKETVEDPAQPSGEGPGEPSEEAPRSDGNASPQGR